MTETNDFFDSFDDVSSRYDSEGRLLSNCQANFFSKSQCVSDDKSLLVVYHASQNNFSVFDEKFIGMGGGNIYGKGFYFCDSNFGLEIYGEYIKEFYLNLKNPFRWEVCDEEADYLYNLDMFLEVLEINNFGITEDLRAELEADLIEDDGGLDTLIEQTCGIDFKIGRAHV